MKNVHSHKSPRHPIIRMETWLSRVCCLGIPKWQCHFGSSPRHLLGLIQSEHPADRAYLSCMHEADQEETIGFDLPDTLTEAGGLEQAVAHYCPNTSACISEEILGFGRELPQTVTRPAAAAAEQHSPEVVAGRLLYSLSIQWQNQQMSTLQQEGDAERKDLRPN